MVGACFRTGQLTVILPAPGRKDNKISGFVTIVRAAAGVAGGGRNCQATGAAQKKGGSSWRSVPGYHQETQPLVSPSPPACHDFAFASTCRRGERSGVRGPKGVRSNALHS